MIAFWLLTAREEISATSECNLIFITLSHISHKSAVQVRNLVYENSLY